MTDDWQLLTKIDHPLAASLLAGWLQAECIPIQLQRSLLQGALGDIPFLEAAVEIWVPAIKFSQASQLLLQYQHQQNSIGPDWLCGQCDETNDAHFEVCWHCGTPQYDSETE